MKYPKKHTTKFIQFGKFDCRQVNLHVGKKYNLSIYTNHIEIINSEMMLDAYSAVAMPIMYNHWSFGESFIQNSNAYNN